MNWTKELPSRLLIKDAEGEEHNCCLHFVGLSWFGAACRLEYYEENIYTDENHVYLSADGIDEEDAIKNMKAKLTDLNL